MSNMISQEMASRRVLPPVRRSTEWGTLFWFQCHETG